MPTIFISYRREDEPAAAGRLYDSLVGVLGERSVFIDVDGISPGLDFVEVIEDVLARCDVLVAVIGRRWLDARDEGGRSRLEDPEDFVRLEIGRALERARTHRDVKVLPVCVEGARMPRADEIPSDLSGLTRLQALSLSHVTWRRDVARLLDWLNAHPQAQGAAARKQRRWRGISQRSRRWKALAATAAAIAVATPVVAVVLTRGGSTNRRAAELVGRPTPLHGTPTAIAAGPGGVWVTELTGVVEDIDPSTGRVRGAPIRVDGVPLGVAVGEGAVWVACRQDHRDGTVSGSVTVIDPHTRRQVGEPIEVGAQPRDVAIGEGGVWTANYSEHTVTRIDPQTRKVRDYKLDDGAEPADIAVGAGAVWVVAFAKQTLLRLNPATGKVLTRIPVPRNPESVVVGAGAVWVASLSRDTVTMIDPKLNQQVGEPIVVGSHPDDMAVWKGALYVAAKDEGLLQRIDPTSHEVAAQPLTVGNEPDALAVDGEKLWVANAADASVVQVASH